MNIYQTASVIAIACSGTYILANNTNSTIEAVAHVGKDIEHLKGAAKEVVHHVGEEVGILEVRQQPQVNHHGED